MPVPLKPTDNLDIASLLRDIESKFALRNHVHSGVDSPKIKLDHITLPATGFIRSGQSSYNTGTGFYLGTEAGTPKLSIGNPSGNYLTWDGTTLTLSGTLSATSGTIGGFTIGSDYIRDNANSMGLASTVTGGDDVRFWAGDTFANRASADFFVTEAGAVTAANITVTGGSVATSTFSGTISFANLDVAAQGWSQTCVFSSSDADTVAWGAGDFIAADGTTYSINAGNTGNMVAATYIYLDTGVSTTAYQTSTTASDAVGAGKVLIAKAEDATGEATFQTYGGIGGQNLDANSIVANCITANELSTSITYAGAIIIDTNGLIRSGQTAYDTGTGWWLGNASGTPKFSIGNSAANKLTWDGSTLSIVGTITSTSGSIGGWTIGSTTIKSASSGERIELDAGNTCINLINSSGSTVATFDYGSGTTDALLKLSPANDARRSLEFDIPAGLGSDAKAITIDNASNSICIDITDGGLYGMYIAGCDTSAIHIQNAATNAATLNFNFSSSDYPVIQMEQGGTSTNSYGIKITQGTSALKEGIYIDGNANSHLAEAIYIDRDANSASDAAAIKIDVANAGAGYPVGIDFSGSSSVAIVRVPTDNTDPTGGGGAATGRIPISVMGVLRYIPYY